jgi:molybdopterin converting factor small subunit
VKLRLRLYAVARQLAGTDVVEIELPDRATVGQLRAGLGARVPALAPIVAHLMFAVDAEYRRDETVLGPEADVACIPPVSGG